jgi:hypothetical protein
MHDLLFRKNVTKQNVDRILRNKEERAGLSQTTAYRTFEIQKNQTETREVQEPLRWAKRVQKVLLKDLQEKIILHPAAKASVGNSYIDNAALHVGALSIFKTDIQQFYTNTTLKKIANPIKNNFPQHFEWFMSVAPMLVAPKHNRRINFVAIDKLTTEQFIDDSSYRLPTGSPTSPFLSNIALLPLDIAIQDYCDRNEGTYTRYLDDITVSFKKELSEDQQVEVRRFVINQIARLGYKYHPRKTRWINSNHDPVVITGVDIRGEQKVTSRYINEQIRPAFQRDINNLFTELQSEFKLIQERTFEELVQASFHVRFKLNYVKQVSPEQYKKLIQWGEKRFEVLAAYRFGTKTSLVKYGARILEPESHTYFLIMQTISVCEDLPF